MHTLWVHALPHCYFERRNSSLFLIIRSFKQLPFGDEIHYTLGTALKTGQLVSYLKHGETLELANNVINLVGLKHSIS
jgi:hypothetical protein